jgi:hypothetical protein
MKTLVLFLFLASSSTSIAAENMYRCKINQIMELSDGGNMEKHKGIYRQLVGEYFSINRRTGAMAGLPFGTTSYRQVTVLDQGSNQNSYKAIVTSHPPNMWVMYIYVAEHRSGNQKPFWGTVDGDKIFSGYCE